MTTLYLVRHGEPLQRGLLLGATDIAISPLGLKELHKTCSSILSCVDLSHVYSSPLKRCHTFAREYATAHNLPFTEFTAIQEINFGDYDGFDIHQLWQEHTELMERFSAQPATQALPNQEPLTSFLRRVQRAVLNILSRHSNGNVLLVTHGGVIKAILGMVTDVDFQSENIFNTQAIDYASTTIIHFKTPTISSAKLVAVNKPS